jgi:prevent-host-death family protein
MLTKTTIPTISAMDLRKEPGTFLDRVDYRRERFIVQRAGKPKAVLISLADFEQGERLKAEAKEEFFAMTDELRARVAASGISAKELDALIDEAVTDVRREQNKSNAV